jgi:GT2 family glycosyltransferase
LINISIVIVSWNSCYFLKGCLSSLFLFPSRDPFEIIVVDNASTDGSREMIRKEFPAVILVENDRNRGFAAACNRGAEKAEGEYLLFLNPDTRVYPGTLEGALDFMRAHPDAGVMGCRTLNFDGTPQSSAYSFPTPLRAFAYIVGLNRIFRISKLRGSDKIRQPDYVQGSFFLIPRNVFEGLGGFDEKFFFYSEEVDLCRRIRDAGRKIYYFPGVRIMHAGGGSKNPLSLVHYAESVIRLFDKHRPARSGKRMVRAVRLAARIRVLRECLSSLLRLRRLDEGRRKTFRALLAIGKSVR